MKARGFCLTVILLAACSLFLFAASPSPVLAVSPTDQIRQSINEVIEILKDKELKQKEHLRREKIRRVVDTIFNWEEMSKRSLGLYWRKRTPEEQKEFVPLFSNLIEDTYVRKIERYENEKVIYTGEDIEGDYATVTTKILTQKGVEVPVNYRLLKNNAKWEVYDVVIEGVSLINNYRTQFYSIIRSGSYEELVKKLKKKVLKEPT